MNTYIVKKEDIRKKIIKLTNCNCCGSKGEIINLINICGPIQKHDIGKMMKKIDNIWYIENQKQFERRMKNERN